MHESQWGEQKNPVARISTCMKCNIYIKSHSHTIPLLFFEECHHVYAFELIRTSLALSSIPFINIAGVVLTYLLNGMMRSE